VNSVGDAFGWAFRDPAWLGKVAVQGLITIIPIVGWIATVGWLMMSFENARSGRNELPQAGFHLARGIGFFGVYIIYAIVLNIPTVVFNSIGSHTVTTTNGFNYTTGSPLGSLWQLLASLFLDFLTPTLIVMVFHHGFAGGFDLGNIWKYATGNPTNSIIGGLIIFVSGLIAGVGIIACCIGVFFTIVYAASIQAAVAAWFERQQSAPAAPAMPPPTPAA
jgi:Protein of unknown function (DUF4013)